MDRWPCTQTETETALQQGGLEAKTVEQQGLILVEFAATWEFTSPSVSKWLVSRAAAG